MASLCRCLTNSRITSSMAFYFSGCLGAALVAPGVVGSEVMRGTNAGLWDFCRCGRCLAYLGASGELR